MHLCRVCFRQISPLLHQSCTQHPVCHACARATCVFCPASTPSKATSSSKASRPFDYSRGLYKPTPVTAKRSEPLNLDPLHAALMSTDAESNLEDVSQRRSIREEPDDPEARRVLRAYRSRFQQHLHRSDNDILLHRVSPGDSLSVLALRYPTSIADLKKANRLFDDAGLRMRKYVVVPLEDRPGTAPGIQARSSFDADRRQGSPPRPSTPSSIRSNIETAHGSRFSVVSQTSTVVVQSVIEEPYSYEKPKSRVGWLKAREDAKNHRRTHSAPYFGEHRLDGRNIGCDGVDEAVLAWQDEAASRW